MSSLRRPRSVLSASILPAITLSFSFKVPRPDCKPSSLVCVARLFCSMIAARASLLLLLELTIILVKIAPNIIVTKAAIYTGLILNLVFIMFPLLG